MFDKNLNMFNSPSCLGYTRFENTICNLGIISTIFLIEESQKMLFVSLLFLHAAIADIKFIIIISATPKRNKT